MNGTIRLMAVTVALIAAGCASIAADEISRPPLEVTMGAAGGSRIEQAARPDLPYVVSLLDGRPFEPVPAWVKAADVSHDYSHTAEPTFAQFLVRDADRNMKWLKRFGRKFDAKDYQWLKFSYRATGLPDDCGEYVLWLVDNRAGHSGGFEAIILRELTRDGKLHSLMIPLARFNPAGPITGAAIKVQSGKDGNATLRIETLEFRRNTPVSVSLLDGAPFEAVPHWVVRKADVSAKHSAKAEYGFAAYRVDEPNREMKWLRVLKTPVNARKLRYLEITYRAENLRDDSGCIIWLADYRKFNGGGFEALLRREIVSDGKPHTILLDLGRFNPAGPIKKIALCLRSGPEGNALFQIDKLKFRYAAPAPASPATSIR